MTPSHRILEGGIKMFTINGKIRREFLKRTAGMDVAVKSAAAPETKDRLAMAAVIPQKRNKEIGVAVVGLDFYGVAAVVTAGDPGKITILF